MKRIPFRLCVSTLFIMSLTSPLLADDFRRCAGSHPEISVIACTRILDAGLLSPRQRADVHNNRGVSHSRNGQHREAISDFTIAINLRPTFAKAYHNRGLAYLNTNKLDQALEDINLHLEFEPGNWRALITRGIIHRRNKRYDEAITDYSKAIGLNPKSAVGYNNRALVHVRNGSLKLALGDMQRATDIAPRNPHIRYRFGNTKFYVGQTSQATQSWREACRLASGPVIKKWQQDLSEKGHFKGKIDSTCQSALIDAFRSCAEVRCLL